MLRACRACSRLRTAPASHFPHAAQDLLQRDVRGGRSVRPHYRAFASWLDETRPSSSRRSARRPISCSTASASLSRSTARSRRRAADPLRHHPAHHSGARAGRCSAPALASASGRSTPSCTTSTTTRRSSRPASSRASRSSAISQYRPEMHGVDVPGDIYAHIAGIDIVGRRRRVLRARGQPAHAVRRVLHAGKPQDDDAAVPGAVRAHRSPGGALPRRAAGQPARGRAGRRRAIRRWCCSRRARTTAPISSTPSSPSRWASNWSRARICSCRRHRLHAHHARARSAWT